MDIQSVPERFKVVIIKLQGMLSKVDGLLHVTAEVEHAETIDYGGGLYYYEHKVDSDMYSVKVVAQYSSNKDRDNGLSDIHISIRDNFGELAFLTLSPCIMDIATRTKCLLVSNIIQSILTNVPKAEVIND